MTSLWNSLATAFDEVIEFKVAFIAPREDSGASRQRGALARTPIVQQIFKMMVSCRIDDFEHTLA